MTNFIVTKSRSYLICPRRRLSCCRFMIIVQEVNEVALLVVVGVGVGTSFVVIIIITGNGFD